MLLNEEQTLIRDAARAFAQEQVAPHARAWEMAGEIPRALLAEMGRLGFMGMCVPPEWGGAVLEAIAVENAIHHERQPFDRRLPARRGTGIEDDRPAGVLGELALDFPGLLVALLGVALA